MSSASLHNAASEINLLRAILERAIVDIASKRNSIEAKRNRLTALYFLNSKHCKDYCSLASCNYKRMKTKVDEYMKKNPILKD